MSRRDYISRTGSYAAGVPQTMRNFLWGQSSEKAKVVPSTQQQHSWTEYLNSSAAYVASAPQGVMNMWRGGSAEQGEVKKPTNQYVEKVGTLTSQAWTGLKKRPMEDYAKLAVCVAPIALVALTPAALSLVGFAAGGIVKGSTAATIMSWYGGNVAAGSACAVMQSVGAAGVGSTALAAATGTSATTGAFLLAKEKIKSK